MPAVITTLGPNLESLWVEHGLLMWISPCITLLWSVVHWMKNKALGYMTDFSETSLETKSHDPRSLWLLVEMHSALGPAFASKLLYTVYRCGCRMIFNVTDIYYMHLWCLWNGFYDLSTLDGFWSLMSIRRFIYIYKIRIFLLHNWFEETEGRTRWPMHVFCSSYWPSETSPQSPCNWTFCSVLLLLDLLF